MRIFKLGLLQSNFFQAIHLRGSPLKTRLTSRYLGTCGKRRITMEGQHKMREYWWFVKLSETPGCICFQLWEVHKHVITIFAHCEWRNPLKINNASNNIKAIMFKAIKQSISFMTSRNTSECKQIWQQLKVVLSRLTTNKMWALSLVLIIMEYFFILNLSCIINIERIRKVQEFVGPKSRLEDSTVIHLLTHFNKFTGNTDSKNDTTALKSVLKFAPSHTPELWMEVFRGKRENIECLFGRDANFFCSL